MVVKPYDFGGTLMAFLAHLEEVEELAKWVRKTIHAHQVATLDMTIDPDFIHLFVSPSFTMLRYSKMKVYGNHFRIDKD
jgi:REP element-mobilizing transposase RayT